MPNGNPDFNDDELPILDSFFSVIADDLNGFALKHNLLISKYWHQIPSWRFSFRHPKGGAACLEVMKEGDFVKIHCYWWLDKYDEFTRYSKRDESGLIKRNGLSIDLLEREFGKIMSWQLGEWSDIKRDYKEFWQMHSRDLIERDYEKYPLPKV